MPIENPKVINKSDWLDPEGAPLCTACAVRLAAPEAPDMFATRLPQTSPELGADCAECVAFAERRHPAMFSTMRTIQEIEAQIAYYRTDDSIELDDDIRRAKIDVLEWVLGVGRHSQGEGEVGGMSDQENLDTKEDKQ